MLKSKKLTLIQLSKDIFYKLIEIKKKFNKEFYPIKRSLFKI